MTGKIDLGWLCGWDRKTDTRMGWWGGETVWKEYGQVDRQTDKQVDG